MGRLKDQIGNFTGVPNSFLSESGQTPASRLLLVYLRFHTNNKSDTAMPGYDVLIKETGLSRQKVAGGLDVLVSTGWLVKNKRFGRSTEYSIQYPEIRDSRSTMEQLDDARSNSDTERQSFQYGTTEGASPYSEQDQLNRECALAPVADAKEPIPIPVVNVASVVGSNGFSQGKSAAIGKGLRRNGHRPIAPVLLPPPATLTTTPEFLAWIDKRFPRWDSWKRNEVIDLWRFDRLSKGILKPAEQWVPDMQAFMLRYKQNENGS